MLKNTRDLLANGEEKIEILFRMPGCPSSFFWLHGPQRSAAPLSAGHTGFPT
jgi:hypothetical protein